MNKIFLIIIIIAGGISASAQINKADTSVTAEIIDLNNKQKLSSDVTRKLVSETKTEKDSVELQKKISALEQSLLVLNKDAIRFRKEISKKEKEKNNIIKELNDVTNLRAEIKRKLAVDSLAYESLKILVIKKKELNDELELKKDTIEEKTNALIAKTNSTQAEYDKLLVEIAKKEDSLEAIARIKLKAKSVILKGITKLKDHEKEENKAKIVKVSKELKDLLAGYNQGNSDLDAISAQIISEKLDLKPYSVNIENVHVFVKEGRIVEIIVRTDKGIFRNTRAQIDLVHFSERRYKDRLYKDDEDKADTVRTFIYPGDVITYEPIRSFGDIPYSEFEITLTPDSAGNTYIIRESTSINTYFEVAAFTDINGIAGSANGLAQITGSAKFITSTRNKANRTLMGLQYISFNGGLAKFDNDFKGTFINSKDSVDRKDLFQRTQYMVGIKVNLLRSVKSPYPNLLFNDLQINAGFNFLGSKIADTLIKSADTSFRTVTHNQFYIEPIVSFSRQKNFNMSFALPVFYQNLKESSIIANRDWEWWICPSINLMYYSKRDSKSKIFFRYNHFINLSDKKQAFNQMQLGYAANLTNIMQGK